MNRQTVLILYTILLVTSGAYSQDSLSTLNTKRLRGFVIGSSITYTASMVGLSELWYDDTPKQSFQFFNDNREWKQVDKVGHFFGAFYTSNITYNSLLWCGVDERKSVWISTLTGFALLLPIEIFDGHSEAYGASAGDLAANFLGASFFFMQRSIWNEVRLRPKFSYRHTNYAAKRPEVLGDTYASRVLKDYNGQTYWLSIDMDKFTPFPRWLNLALGYGADGMVYANDNSNEIAGFDAHRQFYLGIDFDFSAINPRSKFLKGVVNVIDLIKLPAPAIEFSRKGTTLRAFSF